MEKIRLLIIAMTAYSIMAPVKYVATVPSWSLGPTGKLYIDLYKPQQNKEDSRRLCEAEGGHLPKPRNRDESNFLKTFEQKFYIGMNDKNTEGSWVFDDEDSIVTWFDWIDWGGNVQEPNGGANENCVSFWQYAGKAGWVDIPCAEHDKITTVICEKSTAEIPQKCLQDFTRIGGVCYGVFKEKKSWNDAQRSCIAKGSFLAEPKSLQENKNIVDLVKASDGGHTWIGATDRGREGHWVWDHSKTDVSFSNWYPGEPNNNRGAENCAQLSGNAGYNYRWNDLSCNEESSFVCQDCPQGFTRIGGVCYGVFKEKKSWNDAKQSCIAKGSFLAEPKSLKENKNIVDLVKAYDGGNTWIGATAGHWVWDHSETNVAFTAWADGEPNYCAHLSVIAGHNYRWNDGPCNQELSFVSQAFKPSNGDQPQGVGDAGSLKPSACLVYACLGLCLMIFLMK